MSAARCRFLFESVADLQTRLRSKGSDLLIQRGHPEDAIPAVAARLGSGASVVTVYAHTDLCSEEKSVHAAVKSALSLVGSAGGVGGDATGASVTEVWGNTLHDPSDLPKWVVKSVMEKVLSSPEESESDASENLSCASEDESGDDAEP
ncbi:unnamed protein product [Ectocarpus sp. CCAP 1310/34]|nr:unnamed protein product [Ectocarpus sp. CCAP 1310/34]